MKLKINGIIQKGKNLKINNEKKKYFLNTFFNQVGTYLNYPTLKNF